MIEIMKSIARQTAGFLMSAAREAQAEMEKVEMTPREFVSKTLMNHEGGLSMDKTDRGNWFKGKLVGSKYGVTAAALAKFRDVSSISAAQMKALTKDEAISIALQDYYEGPGLDRLEWNAVTASIVDMGYNAGPRTAIRLAQRMIGVDNDGVIGRFTEAAYDDFIDEKGMKPSAAAYCERRIGYYERIIRKRPRNAKYRRGWINRARSFLSSSPWWKKFHAKPAEKSAGK